MPIDLTVKTLDSNVYQFSVPDEFTVKEFKEYIAQTVSVAWDKQRIIFGGKVLQDDRRLADCHVAGKTVHLVQRIPPPVSRGTLPQDEASRAGQSSQQSSQGEHDRVPLDRPGNNVYVGAFTLPHVEVATGDGTGGTEQLDQMIQQVISSMVDIGRQTTRVQQGTTGEGATGINYHVNIAEMNGHQEVHSRLLAVRSLLRLAFNGVNVLEGRPVEEYAVQNPPHLNTRRRDGASSSGATAAPEGGQVNEESTQVEGQASAEEPTEDRTTASGETPSTQSGRPQAERDPRRPLSFLLLDELHPTRQTLAHVYDELDYLNERLAPFLSQYRDLLRRETLTSDEVNAEETRRVTHRVAEVTHAISHVQHLLSDLDIDPRHPANLVVRPVGPAVVGGVQMGSHNEHAVPVRAQINVNTVAILSNGNGNLSAGEVRTGQAPTAQGLTVGQAAAQVAGQAAAHVASHAAAHIAGQAAAQVAGAVQHGIAVQQQMNQIRSSTNEPERPSHSFSPVDFLRRVSDAAARSVARSYFSSSGNANTEQTPSREETTASNTTTATTQTPTTAGAAMGGPTPGAVGGGGAAFTVPTATASHQGLRPSAVITDVFDPFLVCDSIFSATGRRAERQAGRLSFTIPVRSSSVPAAMTRRPMETETPPPTRPTNANAAGLLEAFVHTIFPGVFNSMPMASFINWEVGGEGQQNEFINDLLATITATITTSDVVEILGQNYRSLNGLRLPLREFLNRRLLNGEPYSVELLRTRLFRLIDSMSRDIEHETREADVDPSIDLVATFSGFLKARVFEIFKYIFEAGEGDNFGDRLAELSIALIKDLLSLLTMCCRDGAASVERVLLARTRELELQDLELPLLTALMSQHGARRENFQPNDALRVHIVRRPVTASGRQEERVPSAMATGDPPAASRMEVDAPTTVLVTSEPRASTNGLSTDNVQVTLEPPMSHESALSALRGAVPEAAPSAGSEWMNGIPPGWAPIIARDMGSQSSSQRPLSDAYLAGMPSKRRRLMKTVSPSQLSDIPASIQQAIQRAGVRPNTSVDALNADVQRNTVALQGALQNSIRDALAKRLTEETVDFNKDRFPHAHRMTKPK